MRLAYLVFVLLLVGCRSTDDKVSSKMSRNPKSPTLHDSIQGVWWADTSDPAAAFWIDGDTIRDPDHFTEDLISLRGDSLTVKYPDFEVTQHVAMRGRDTMILSGGPDYDSTPAIYFKWDNEP